MVRNHNIDMLHRKSISFRVFCSILGYLEFLGLSGYLFMSLGDPEILGFLRFLEFIKFLGLVKFLEWCMSLGFLKLLEF